MDRVGLTITAAAFLGLAVVPAQAATLWDTGAGVVGLTELDKDRWSSGFLAPWSGATITGLEGFMDVQQAGDLTLAVWTSDHQRPFAEVFSETIAVGASSGPAWIGATDLDWELVGGDYWFAFEVAPTSTFRANFYGHAPDPLHRYALGVGPDGTPWSLNGVINLGIRVSGESDGPVFLGPQFVGIPEPASWALMIGGFGLAGAALRHRNVDRRAVRRVAA